MARIRGPKLDRNPAWKEEYDLDQQTLELAIWHIQNLEDQYLKEKTFQVVDQLQYWYDQVHRLRNKKYF
jgi:hypothetical protein